MSEQSVYLDKVKKKDSKCTLFVAIVGYSPEINSS